MRVLRTLVGVVLLIVGVPAAFLAAAGWTVMRHGDDGFGAAHIRLRTAGRAVLVPDAAAFADAAAALPGPDRVRLTVRSGSGPLLVALVPADAAARYLDGVARAEVRGAGNAVRIVEVGGDVAPAVDAPLWTGGPSDPVRVLDWTPAPGMALVVTRADGLAGVDATLGVGAYPIWLGDGAPWLLVLGTAAVVAGIALLVWPARRREVVLVVEAHRMVEFADQLAGRVGAGRVGAGRVGAGRVGASRLGREPADRRHDVTGEVVVLAQPGRDRYLNDTGRVTALDPNAALHEGTDESPYVSTAT